MAIKLTQAEWKKIVNTVLAKPAEVSYNPAYDDFDQPMYAKRAKRLGLAYEYDEAAVRETVSGPVKQLFKYFKDANDGDYGFTMGVDLEFDEPVSQEELEALFAYANKQGWTDFEEGYTEYH